MSDFLSTPESVVDCLYAAGFVERPGASTLAAKLAECIV